MLTPKPTLNIYRTPTKFDIVEKAINPQNKTSSVNIVYQFADNL